MALRIELLARRHRAILGDFRNQHASLVEYLQRYALRHIERHLLARTYLAIDDTPSDRVAGYFSLATASVERASLARNARLDRLPGFPIPAVLLARLAVDERVQGQGLGRYLLEEALGLAITVGRAGPIGFRLLVTDAIDDAAAQFYERFGFARLSDKHPYRMVLDLQPLLAREHG